MEDDLYERRMRIQWTPRALQDLEDIFEYLSQEDPASALSVLDRIEKAISHLMLYPEIGRKGRIPETRELIISGIPFFAVYRIRKDAVHILALYHGAQLFPDMPDL